MRPKIRLLPFFTMPSAIWSGVVALIHPATDLGVVVASTEVDEAGLPAAPVRLLLDASFLALPRAREGALSRSRGKPAQRFLRTTCAREKRLEGVF
jgi:hypothetical protein